MEIFALILIIIGIVAVVGFAVAFFIELAKDNDMVVFSKETTVKSAVKETKIVEDKSTQEEFDLDTMLAELEASATENANQEETEAVIEPVFAQEQPEEELETQEDIVAEEGVEPVEAEEVEPTSEIVITNPEEEIVEAEPVEAEEVSIEEVTEPVEEISAEEVAEPAEEVEQVIVPSDEDVKVEDRTATSKVIVVKEKTTEVINNNVAPATESIEPEKQEVIDLSTRLESVRESMAKVDNDLIKANREINKYERTERRMARNQKLLDKKAEDLTKLNLVLYSVTDIKNIDADKKSKQEDLVTHINELKVSIKDAETYLESNREKNENSLKMKSFFEGEKARLKADETEILRLMNIATEE